MPDKKGIIALMGSGELTATMVEVHKELLAGLPDHSQAVFLDTPAGFELNADQISQRAVDYFLKHVQQPMKVAGFKSRETVTAYEAARTFQKLKAAHYVLIGPGSPTYAVRQWRETPIPDILATRVEGGACLVAASAAALTVGRLTLPVYEIYKVGQELHWVEGTNILARFGFNLVVIPHWNNAEGGTHDTRFCYMGEERLKQLEALMPADAFILGLDEHTACIMDLENDEFVIRGIGNVTLRRGGLERIFRKGVRFPLQILRTGEVGESRDERTSGPLNSAHSQQKEKDSFWDRVNALERAFSSGLEQFRPEASTNALLELDRIIWGAQEAHESLEFISQARDILREMIVSIGLRLDAAPGSREECLAPLVEELLALREKFRAEKQYGAADAIRDSLMRAGIIVEDTREGTRWRLP